MVAVGVHVAHGVVAVDLRGVHRVLFVKVDFKCLEELLQFSSALPYCVPLTNICDGMPVEIRRVREPSFLIAFGFWRWFEGALRTFRYDHVAAP